MLKLLHPFLFRLQLSGQVVERRPVTLESWVQTPDGKPKNFQTWLSSAETQQPVSGVSFILKWGEAKSFFG